MPAETRARPLAVDGDDLLALAAETTRAGGSVWVHVRGASMTPAIPRGSDVRIGPVPARPLRRGDVVLARDPRGRPLVHRVWLRIGDRLWLKGDARVTPDRAVASGEILGMVEAVRRDGRLEAIPPRPRVRPRELAQRWRAVVRDALRGG